MDADEVDGPDGAPVRWVWWVVCLAFAIALGACGGDGGESADESRVREPSRVEGFAETAFRVLPDGTRSEEPPTFCALLADSEDRWQQGLTDRNDLAGYEGMVFRFDRDVDTAFHMRDTPLPLSIAWFDSNGVFISSADMEPCLGQEECPAYRATRPYRYAIEVPRGTLARLKLGPGAVVDFGGPCPSAT